jgi:hypothetical protein
MIAPMFGMIMFDRNVPNLCTRSRADPLGAAVLVTVAMLDPPGILAAAADGQALVGQV